MYNSKRLNKIFECIPNCNLAIDVGADHGKLTQMLISSGKAKRVIATDISAQSLEKTIKLVKDKGIEDRVDCMVTDGLEKLDGPPYGDVVVIAGMGGNEIVSILKAVKDLSKFGTFIIQPMQNPDVVRSALNALNGSLMLDIIVEERGKFYSVMQVNFNSEPTPLTLTQIHLGKDYKTNSYADFLNYITFKRNTLLQRKNYLTSKDLKILQCCERIINQ